MACFVICLVAAVALQLVVAQNVQHSVDVTVVSSNSESLNDSCPSQDNQDIAKKIIERRVFDIIQQIHLVPDCGDGLWYRVAYLNMSDPSQQCPSVWREYTSDGIRMCARPTSSGGNCPSTLYPVSHQYSKVCGKVIGYQFGSPDAFAHGITTAPKNLMIDQPYLDGISITHGTPDRTHIWSYVAGASENGTGCSFYNCPCSNSDYAPPSYVGDNYYCESAFQGDCFVTNVFLPNDPLWDGQQCDNEGTCCTGANTPPWFSVELPDSTSDDIEVRICHDQNTTDEDTPIQLLELYVQ